MKIVLAPAFVNEGSRYTTRITQPVKIGDLTLSGTTIGHTDDTDLLTLASGIVTVAGEISTTTLDIGGTDVTSTGAELNLVDGSTANTVVNSKAVIYGSSGELAGTLSTAAQGSVTSLGTLTALTVDNIAINGTNIGHTGDTDLLALTSQTLTVAGHIMPSGDNSFDIGDVNAAWKDLWIEGDIHLTNAGTISTDAGDLTLNPAANIYTADDVGIGVGAADKLHVSATKNSQTEPYAGGFRIDDDETMAEGVGGLIVFYGKYSGSTKTTFATIHGSKNNGTSDNYDGNLILATRVQGAGTTEKMRITYDGSVQIGGTASHGTTRGTGTLSLFNAATAPVGTLTNGASFYVASGEMQVIDSGGNVTLLSPHDDEGKWVFHSRDTSGKVLHIHMERLMRRLDEEFGGGFIEEFIEEEE